MIREVKLEKQRVVRKNKRNSGKKNSGKRTKKQVGGGSNSKSKDNFEITSLTDVDTSKYSISRYVNANIDWGIMPGPPPTDCRIM